METLADLPDAGMEARKLHESESRKAEGQIVGIAASDIRIGGKLRTTFGMQIVVLMFSLQLLLAAFPVVARADTGWSAPAPVDPPVLFPSVSCSSSSFCAAVGRHGHATTYDGASWSTPGIIDDANNLSSASCSSTSFCAAVDVEGNSVTYDGSNWSARSTSTARTN